MSFLLEGITAVTWQQAVMYVVGIILIWLAVKKEYEPSLLLPLGFWRHSGKPAVFRCDGPDGTGKGACGRNHRMAVQNRN